MTPVDLVPPPKRPPSGGRVVLHVFLAMLCAFVFTQLLRFGLLAIYLNADSNADAPVLVTLFGLPIVGVAAAAVAAGRRGMKGVAIGLWIYVGLGILLTAYCGVLAWDFHI